MANPKKSGLATAGLVLGIIGIVLSLIPIINNFAFVLAVLALIFGIVILVNSKKNGGVGRGKAIAAVVLGAVTIILVIASQALYGSVLNQVNEDSGSSSGSSKEDTSSSTDIEPVTTDQNEEPDVPAEYQSALNQAKTYANSMHMSKQGVYDQLISEYGGQFEAPAAQYAIDNVEADWNANALAKAKTYQDDMSMSPAAIRDQLISEHGEQFTPEEADYAITHLNN